MTSGPPVIPSYGCSKGPFLPSSYTMQGEPYGPGDMGAAGVGPNKFVYAGGMTAPAVFSPSAVFYTGANANPMWNAKMGKGSAYAASNSCGAMGSYAMGAGGAKSYAALF